MYTHYPRLPAEVFNSVQREPSFYALRIGLFNPLYAEIGISVAEKLFNCSGDAAVSTTI